RRRHTRSKRDWSSDVCSSDLILLYGHPWKQSAFLEYDDAVGAGFVHCFAVDQDFSGGGCFESCDQFQYCRLSAAGRSEKRNELRSEERRVGKESQTGV